MGSKKGKARLHAFEKSVDVIAILIPKKACWYLFPVRALKGRSSVSLSPGKVKERYSKYRNAWRVLEKEAHEAVKRQKTKGAKASQ